MNATRPQTLALISILVGITLATAWMTRAIRRYVSRPDVMTAARLSSELTGVPWQLLVSMAYAESRLEILGGDRKPTGWIKLVPWRSERNQERAARLVGSSVDEVVRKPEVAMHATAAVLADIHARLGLCHAPRVVCWEPVLKVFNSSGDDLSDAAYASQVLSLAHEGFSSRDEYGREVTVFPWLKDEVTALPELHESSPPGRQGVATVAFVAAATTTHRPPTVAPRRVRYIVIHTTEASFSGLIGFFRRPGTPVGTHYLIRAHDGLPIQLVDEQAVAFHDACFNEESIGIEHEGYTHAGVRWYTDAMYRSSARLVRDISQRHGIPLDRQHILGHGEAPDCSDHTDPGPQWDWGRFMRYVHDLEVSTPSLKLHQEADFKEARSPEP